MVEESKTKQCECISGRGKFFLDLELFHDEKERENSKLNTECCLKNKITE